MRPIWEFLGISYEKYNRTVNHTGKKGRYQPCGFKGCSKWRQDGYTLCREHYQMFIAWQKAQGE